MIKYTQPIGILSMLLMIGCCLLPWAYIPGKEIVVSGFNAEGTSFGKPGLMNLYVGVCMSIFFLLPKIWAKRTNVFFAAFNMAWALRNLILIGACMGGICPEKKAGLYGLVFFAALGLFMTFFPNVTINKKAA
ncbi:MAG: hypothetical protein MUF12_05060 [Sediminibacterium sp.]|jgi:hypothetical protein|nr:hypothetical protein [Hydrotalea sp.]MCU0337215.1 hypothetical protein [Sediminibacterium sp.]